MDLQRLRDAPVENEDAFQHIDDDMLAQVPIAFVLYRWSTNYIPKLWEIWLCIWKMLQISFQGLAHVKEASLKSGSSHSQQVSRFHKNLKGAQVSSFLRMICKTTLSPGWSCGATGFPLPICIPLLSWSCGVAQRDLWGAEVWSDLRWHWGSLKIGTDAMPGKENWYASLIALHLYISGSTINTPGRCVLWRWWESYLTNNLPCSVFIILTLLYFIR